MKAAPKGRREPGGGGPHPRQVEPMISMQILPTKRRFQRSNGGSTVHYPGRLHRGHSGPLGNYITEMMETAATQGREIKAVDRWMVSGKSLIIREMALVPLQLLEKEMAAALACWKEFILLLEQKVSAQVWQSQGGFFFFFSAWQHLSELSGGAAGAGAPSYLLLRWQAFHPSDAPRLPCSSP